jgi:DNA-binding NarL/FixJ family response regulator
VTRFRILVADDHEVVRRGIRSLLKAHPGWEVCAEVGEGRQAVERTIELQPDIVILDISMPDMNGLTAAREILHQLPKQRILVLTMYDSEKILHDALQVGVRGVVLKSDASLDLVRAVQALEQDMTFFTPRLARTMTAPVSHRSHRDREPASGDLLTHRELEVVQLLAEGKSAREVGVALNISVKTVETHRTNLMHKLDIHSLSGLVRYAVRNNIIQVSPAA